MSPKPRRPPKERPPDPSAVEATQRLFLAVPLPDPVREMIGRVTAEMAAEGWPVRWVAAAGAHVTLHFLGETTPERAELLRLALPAVAARHAGFDLRTAGIGVFPVLRRPRVIWLGLHGPAHRLATLHGELGTTLVELGFAVEAGPYHPHVTLGRVRDPGPGVSVRGLPEALRPFLADTGPGGRPQPAPMPVPVREVALVRSLLGHGGARYETVGSYPLAAPEEGRR
jgi:2'-5' RNA ligase